MRCVDVDADGGCARWLCAVGVHGGCALGESIWWLRTVTVEGVLVTLLLELLRGGGPGIVAIPLVLRHPGGRVPRGPPLAPRGRERGGRERGGGLGGVDRGHRVDEVRVPAARQCTARQPAAREGTDTPSCNIGSASITPIRRGDTHGHTIPPPPHTHTHTTGPAHGARRVARS